MRLKPFIVFLIIFTIIYFVGFMIYDHFKNKKDEEKTIANNLLLLSVEKLKKFALFYNVNITINDAILNVMFEELKNINSIPISTLTNKYNITKEELIIIIEYLEYFGLMRTLSIHNNQDLISILNTKEDALIIKYSIQFSNKYDYNTILRNVGLGADKEIEMIIENHLIPGVKLENSTLIYVGDLDG
jgi:hypothetical protein